MGGGQEFSGEGWHLGPVTDVAAPCGLGFWGLLLLWALAYAVVPVILASQLEKIASEKLGRRVTVGQVDFKPWSLELMLKDLAIAKSSPAGARSGNPRQLQPGAVPQLMVKHIYI